MVLYIMLNIDMFLSVDTLGRDVVAFLRTHATPERAAKDETRVWPHIRNLMAKPLIAAFNAPANRHHEQPAKILERKHDLQDIAGDYHMPAGLKAPMVEAFAIAINWMHRRAEISTDEALARMHPLLDRMIELNPAMSVLRFDRNNVTKCVDCVMGMTSGFNRDDMQFFLDGNYFQMSMDKPEYASKFTAAAQLLNRDGLGWVPAPATLDKIITQAKLKR